MKNTFFVLSNGLWFFRIFGYGLHWKNTDKHPLLFSQRNGYRKALTIGNWCFTILRPERRGGAV